MVFGDVVLEPVEAKASREVLTSYEFTESHPEDLGSALIRLEGVWRLRKGGIANDVVIRGFQGNDLSVVVDSSRLFGACPNRMDPPVFHVDLSEVREIRVVKGPFDVKNYGSIGGTVELITERPRKGFRIKLSTIGGSFEHLNPNLKLSYRNGRGYLLLGYSYRFSKPYRTGEGKRFTEYTNYKEAFRDTTAFSLNTGWVKVGLNLSETTSMEVSYTFQRIRDVLYPYLLMDSPEDNADRINLRLRSKELTVQFYFSRVYHRMDNTKRTAPMFMETVARTRTVGFKVLYTLGNITFGLEGFRWDWSSDTTLGTKIQHTLPDTYLSNAGIFLEASRKVSDRVSFKGGLRLDRTETKADPGKANTDLYYTYHNTRDTSAVDTYPSGNLQVVIKPAEGIDLFLGAGYGVRSPDPQERYFALDRPAGPDWVGNPKLKPSKNTELDVGLELRRGVFSLKGSLFASYVKDFITLVSLGTEAKSYANVDARFFGGELSGNIALTDTLFLSGGLSYVMATKETDPSRNIRDKDVAEIPPLKGRASIRYDTGERFLELEVLVAGTQDRVDSDLSETKTPGWAILNLKGGFDMGSFRLTAGVDNLLNKFYYEHLSYLRDPFSAGIKVPEPGRRFFLNLSYTF